MGFHDCEWIILAYLSYFEGSWLQCLKGVDMNQIPSHSAFNPAYAIKEQRGVHAAAASGWDGEGILLHCEPFFHAKPHYLTTLKLWQSLEKLLQSFLINSLGAQMKESSFMKNHHQNSSTHLDLIKPSTILNPLIAMHLPMVTWINSAQPMD